MKNVRMGSPMKTVRQQMIDLLEERECSARDLSQLLGVSEKDAIYHLSHIQRSTANRNKRLIVEPARCVDCGYEFIDRKRIAKPGRCPRCRGEHIEDPRYRIDG